MKQGAELAREAFRRGFILSDSGDHWPSGIVLDPVSIDQAPSGCHVTCGKARERPVVWAGRYKWLLEPD